MKIVKEKEKHQKFHKLKRVNMGIYSTLFLYFFLSFSIFYFFIQFIYQFSYFSYGMAADWWSIGVMIYEMLCGYPTFRGADLKQTYQKVLYGDVQFTDESYFSPSSRELILGLLQRYFSIIFYFLFFYYSNS